MELVNGDQKETNQTNTQCEKWSKYGDLQKFLPGLNYIRETKRVG